MLPSPTPTAPPVTPEPAPPRTAGAGPRAPELLERLAADVTVPSGRSAVLHGPARPAPTLREQLERNRGEPVGQAEQSGDPDLDVPEPGRDGPVAGTGPASAALAALPGEGRGGGPRRNPTGSPQHVPSGLGPVLHVGSRRGAPYGSRTGDDVSGTRPALPWYLHPSTARARARGGRPDLRADVRPLVGEELAGGHHEELFARHPHRTAVRQAEFDERFAAVRVSGAARGTGAPRAAEPDGA